MLQTLSINQMEALQGGGHQEVKEIIDGACAVIGVAGLFGGPVGWGASAFCAGWGLGSLL